MCTCIITEIVAFRVIKRALLAGTQTYYIIPTTPNERGRREGNK